MLRQAKSKTPQCFTCPSYATVQCWGVDLCAACHGEWWFDPQFEAAAIEKAMGIDSKACPKPGDSALYCAEATRRTTAWANQQRSKARAA